MKLPRRKFAFLLVLLPALAFLAVSPGGELINAKPGKLPPREQVLQALNRLTFGPRPGDADRVEQLGLKKWIDLQLHPDRIDENPVLAAKLAPLETLRISQAEAARNYPTPQLLRAIASGREKLPADPVERAAALKMLMRFRVKKGASEDQMLEPAVPLDSLLERPQIRLLRTGTLEQKRDILASVPPEKLDELAIAMPPGLRQQLLPAASPELRRKLMLMNAPQQLIGFDLAEGKLYRAIYSNRQLEEVLTDFWYNHFNVFLDKGADRLMVPTYERESIRPHVLGKFRDLLEATAKSPAMLFYLDNWESVAPAQPRPGANRQARHARAKRKLRARIDGAAHAGRRWRLHPEGRDRSGALLHRLDHPPAARRRRFFLQRSRAR